MMHAAPIQPREMTQTAVRSDTGANKPARIAEFGIHHASKLVRLLLSQSREMSVVGLLMVELGTTRRGAWLAGALGLNWRTRH